MKQKDLALIGVVVMVSAIIALVVSRVVFSTSAHKQTAEVVDVITTEFPAPPSKYFNANSVNPTQQIQIGNGSNPTPFNAKQ